MFFTSNLISLLISYLVTLPCINIKNKIKFKKYFLALGVYGSWILIGTLLPFTIYIFFFYETEFKKSKKEGIYSSFRCSDALTFENPQNTTDITLNS